MRSVGIRELREHTSEIIRWVRDEGQEVQVTHYGQPVARLMPIIPASDQAQARDAPSPHAAAVWAELDQLAAEISARIDAQLLLRIQAIEKSD